jgi:hypothetical protein
MAIISRTFVSAKFSPALSKLILGKPCHFLDLLNSNQKLFQDLLKVMLLPSDAVSNLGVRMPGTSAPAEGENVFLTEEGNLQKSWNGRYARRGAFVDVHNRIEYVYRKTEHQLFGRFKPQVGWLVGWLLVVLSPSLSLSRYICMGGYICDVLTIQRKLIFLFFEFMCMYYNMVESIYLSLSLFLFS